MSTHASDKSLRLANYLSWLLAAIMFLLPLVTPLIIWKSTIVGHLDVLRIWKELLLAACLPLFIWVAWQQPKLRSWLRSSWLPRLMLFYAIFSVLMGLNAIQLGDANAQAVIYGLLINLRFLGFFMLVLAVAGLSPILSKNWRIIVIIPASIVILFGLLQYFVLPPDFLRHLGYGPDTIPFLQTVDNKIEFQRIQATLRGANPLGAYLVLVLPLGWLILQRWQRVLFVVGGALVLLLTYSRSAWLGLVATVGSLGLVRNTSRSALRIMALVLVAALLFGGAVLWLARDVDLVQNTIFHSDESSTSSESSNAGRLRSLQTGAEDTIREPFGRGVGTAGPASFRNTQPPRIAENYFIQLIQEVGWLGLGVFIAINYMVGAILWQRRKDGLALILLATLIGITAINMLSHAWTDEVLSYLWWGLAALAVTPLIQKSSKSSNTKP